MGYHVILENSFGGELDGRFAKSEDDIKNAIIDLAKDCVFSDGDVIRVVEAKAKRRYG